ncbi:transposase, partial [Micromonospora chersina]|uniref:transposase n=1 Tax=Micromonospora chersina TaxID=47854 RepID=UPI0037BAD702
MASLAAAARHDLSDIQWQHLYPLLPAESSRGRPCKWSRRQIIDGIRWRVRTGAPWRDVP